MTLLEQLSKMIEELEPDEDALLKAETHQDLNMAELLNHTLAGLKDVYDTVEALVQEYPEWMPRSEAIREIRAGLKVRSEEKWTIRSFGAMIVVSPHASRLKTPFDYPREYGSLKRLLGLGEDSKAEFGPLQRGELVARAKGEWKGQE